MIKYQYAQDEKDNLVDIRSLKNKRFEKNKYFCIGCGNELIAKLGIIKVHHFAHKKEVKCSGETYLHKLGKQLFIDFYNESLRDKTPFYIELLQDITCNHYEADLGFNCKVENSLIQFDLTKYFDEISLEAREGNFVPDIMLKSKEGKDKIFIEIAVTHMSTPQKLNSKYRVIELKIENECDFDSIKRKKISITDNNIVFKNFNPKKINTSICKGNCKVEYNFFTLDKEGRCLLRQRNFKQIKNFLNINIENLNLYKVSRIDDVNYSEVFLKGVANLSNANYNVRNCFICRYHAENNSWHYEDTSGLPIFCKYLKIKCNSNQAVNCEYFKLENKYINEILGTIENN